MSGISSMALVFIRRLIPKRIRRHVIRAYRRISDALQNIASKCRARRIRLSLQLRASPREHLMPVVNGTRQSWEELFIRLWEPLLPYFSKEKAYIRVRGPQYGVPGKIGGHHEAFSRSFIGAAFFLALKDDSVLVLEDGRQIDLAAIYREGIASGTNPKSKEYWGKRKTIGRLVENCSVAVGLMLTERHIWSKLSGEERDRVLDWFRSETQGSFIMNNWQWFKVFHLLLLEKLGGEDRREEILKALELIDKMYVGEGWYRDGLNDNAPADYYTAWAMHYYGLLFAHLAPDRHAERKEILKERARDFFRTYQYLFAPNYHPPLYGRSQTYRWASVSPWGLGFLLDCIDDSVDTERIKSAVVSAVNSFLEKGALREDGVLTCGYYREFLPMLEGYSSTGSPYWAFKGFSFLLLPDDHPFWKIPGERRDDEESVRTVKAVDFLISNSAASHVLLYPNAAAVEYPLKYDKFAYSNKFLMNYDAAFPVDNSLLLKVKGKGWMPKGEVLQADCEDGISCSVWRPAGKHDILVKSVLVALPNGYLIIHQSLARGELEYCLGGLSLPSDSRHVKPEITTESILLEDGELRVGIALLQGKAEAGIHRAHNKNPAAPYAYVPYYRGCFSGKGDIVAAAIWGCLCQEAFEIPTLEIEDDRWIVRQGNKTFEIPWSPYRAWSAG